MNCKPCLREAEIISKIHESKQIDVISINNDSFSRTDHKYNKELYNTIERELKKYHAEWQDFGTNYACGDTDCIIYDLFIAESDNHPGWPAFIIFDIHGNFIDSFVESIDSDKNKKRLKLITGYDY